MELPEGVFEVIVIDPPWPYGNSDHYDPANFRATTPYLEMSLEELADLEIPAAEDCVLWLWTTHRFMRHAFPLLDSWGFQDKVIVTWKKDRFGVGKWLRSQSEFCIMAVKGRPKVDLTNQTTVLDAPCGSTAASRTSSMKWSTSSASGASWISSRASRARAGRSLGTIPPSSKGPRPAHKTGCRARQRLSRVRAEKTPRKTIEATVRAAVADTSARQA